MGILLTPLNRKYEHQYNLFSKPELNKENIKIPEELYDSIQRDIRDANRLLNK